jgi:hypothetical protein
MEAFAEHLFSECRFSGRTGAHKDGLKPELFVQGIVQSYPGVGSPIFPWVAGARDERDSWTGKMTEKVGLPLFF